MPYVIVWRPWTGTPYYLTSSPSRAQESWQEWLARRGVSLPNPDFGVGSGLALQRSYSLHLEFARQMDALRWDPDLARAVRFDTSAASAEVVGRLRSNQRIRIMWAGETVTGGRCGGW